MNLNHARLPIPPFPQNAFAAERRTFGGQGWIRTTEVCDGRFTVCSLWPLGNPSIYMRVSYLIWSWRWDLNPQPADYKSAALPIELHQHGLNGCERRRKKMATRKGLEPSTSSVTGWHSKPTELPGRKWWAFRDLNPGPTGYEPAALTN